MVGVPEGVPASALAKCFEKS